MSSMQNDIEKPRLTDAQLNAIHDDEESDTEDPQQEREFVRKMQEQMALAKPVVKNVNVQDMVDRDSDAGIKVSDQRATQVREQRVQKVQFIRAFIGLSYNPVDEYKMAFLQKYIFCRAQLLIPKITDPAINFTSAQREHLKNSRTLSEAMEILGQQTKNQQLKMMKSAFILFEISGSDVTEKKYGYQGLLVFRYYIASKTFWIYSPQGERKGQCHGSQEALDCFVMRIHEVNDLRRRYEYNVKDSQIMPFMAFCLLTQKLMDNRNYYIDGPQ